ncbi:MAG: hypothetical protein M3237_04880 [Actinomycetota bacterium]|nr:hypothetical protein [Actinomycetota bacterium]
MRGFLSGLVALLAALVLPIAITAVWTAERVTDTNGYVGAVGPLADDPDVQAALTGRLEQYAADAVGLEELGGAQEQVARQAITAAVTAAVTDPSFRPAWESANRAGHAELIRTLRDDQSGRIAPLDLAVVIEPVLDTLRAQGLPVRDVQPPGLVFTPDHRPLRAAQEGYQTLDAARLVLPVAWVALVVIALAVARRRLRALAILAGASIVSVALMWPVLAVGRSGALEAVPEADRELGEAVWDGVTQSLERSASVAIVVAAVALVVAVVLGLVRSGRSAPAGAGDRC